MAARYRVHRDEENSSRFRWDFQSANGRVVFKSVDSFGSVKAVEKSIALAKGSRRIKIVYASDIEVE